MSTWGIILAALEAIPVIAKALTELIAVAGRIADDVAKQRALAELKEAGRKAEQTGDTSGLEDWYRKRSIGHK